MTDEQKTECKCECKEIAAKFLLLTTSIFVGTLLAIIFAALLLKPAVPPCPCQKAWMHKMPPRMERQFGPQKDFGRHHKNFKHFNIENEMPQKAPQQK